jgi:hypothetical protein
MAQFRAIHWYDHGPRYDHTVSQSHKLLKKAADRWATGHPEQPATEEVLAQMLELFRKRQFLHLPPRTAVDPYLLTWNDGAIPKLARTISDEQAFERLPILADALEEAGCRDADLLAHCREPVPHLPGCWVVDHLLGKTAFAALEQAHRILYRAALDWIEGNPEEPATQRVLRQILDAFLRAKVLRLPYGMGPG